MKNVAVIFADGFEEIEAVSVVDILRRAGANVSIVGLDSALVRGSHDIVVKTNLLLSELDESKFDMIVLPGGLPGSQYLAENEKLGEILQTFNKNKKFIAAICAAPIALAKHNVLKNSFVCYPGFEANVREFGYVSGKNVVIDENIITSRGPATAIEFALNLVKVLFNEQKFQDLKSELLA